MVELVLGVCIGLAAPCGLARAQGEGDEGSRWQRFKQMREAQRASQASVVSEASLGAVADNLHEDAFDGREMLVYVPSRLPATSQRAMLVALHGGGGNARFMLEHLKIDGVAERHGFIVAYLNGTAAARLGGRKLKAWNAGSGCCGKPYEDGVDDVGYIAGAVGYLQQRYGAAAARTFGVGHSNGAMMMQTMACRSEVFVTVASLAGTLMAGGNSCPAASHRTILNYHGAEDAHVPLAGGRGAKSVADVDFVSQQQAQARFERAGGRYVLQVLPGADHSVENMSRASQRADGLTLAERLARDLGLTAR